LRLLHDYPPYKVSVYRLSQAFIFCGDYDVKGRRDCLIILRKELLKFDSGQATNGNKHP